MQVGGYGVPTGDFTYQALCTFDGTEIWLGLLFLRIANQGLYFNFREVGAGIWVNNRYSALFALTITSLSIMAAQRIISKFLCNAGEGLLTNTVAFSFSLAKIACHVLVFERCASRPKTAVIKYGTCHLKSAQSWLVQGPLCGNFKSEKNSDCNLYCDVFKNKLKPVMRTRRRNDRPKASLSFRIMPVHRWQAMFLMI
jgi:hypothetical protein